MDVDVALGDLVAAGCDLAHQAGAREYAPGLLGERRPAAETRPSVSSTVLLARPSTSCLVKGRSGCCPRSRRSSSERG